MHATISRTALVSTLLALAAGAATAQTPERWGGGAGVNMLETARGNGTGFQLDLRRHLFEVAEMVGVGVNLSGTSGSLDYSLFACEVARRQYCFGGSETVKSLDVGLSVEHRMEGSSKFQLSQRVFAGMNAAWSNIRETEGPTMLCVIDDQLVSCPDNPPFQQMSRVANDIAPSIGMGFEIARRYRGVMVGVDVTIQQVGLFDWSHRRVGLAARLGR
jgi:hypothetical protein